MFNEIYNVIAPYLPGLAFLTSLVSLYFAITSIRRTTKYQTFDYSPRLDVKEEIVQVVSNRGGQKYISSFGSGTESGNCPELIKSYGFAYQALLLNQGSKVVEVSRTSILYGSEESHNALVNYIIAGRFNLPPGDSRKLSFSMSSDELDKFLEDKKLNECLFHLKVVCLDAKGKDLVFRRSLGGYRDNAVHFNVQSGDSLILAQ